MSRWSMPIRPWVQRTKGNIDQACRAVALEMFNRIIVRSPVDTGRFRGNWQLDVRIEPSGILAEVDPTGGATIEKARAAISAFKVGYTIMIRNNLPYAVALENGHSGQAPTGVVKVTVAEFHAIAANAAGGQR